MRKIIFYGVNDDAASSIKCLKNYGYEIVCLIDENEALWNSKISFFGNYEYEVLSPRKAIEKFGLLDVYYSSDVTQFSAGVDLARKYGIPLEQMRNFNGRTFRRSCGQLINNVMIGDTGFKPCCSRFANAFLKTQIVESTDWVDAYNNYIQIRQETLDKAERNEPCICDGCPRLVYDFYPVNTEIKNLNYFGDFCGERCNMSCTYCNRANWAIENQTKGEFFPDAKFTIIDPLEAMADVLPKKLTISETTSEITVSKYRKPFFDLIREHDDWLFNPIVSNCLLFDEDIKYFLTRGASLNCSLDCGTKDTYYLIKRIDGFDIVLKNLKKYRKYSANISLKYILLEGINDNERDIDGFMEIAKKVASFVRISSDSRINTTDISQNWMHYFDYFVASAKRHGVICSRKIPVQTVKADDYKKIVCLLEGR